MFYTITSNIYIFYWSFFYMADTVNSEIFARILFSRIVLKRIFGMLKIHDKGVIYLYQ